jgi:type I restriction enzyme S subunit
MSHLSYLDKLLDGAEVSWKGLGDVAEYSKTRVDATSLNTSSFVGVDNLVANKGGRVNSTYMPNTVRLTAYEVGDILIGNIRPYLKKIWKAINSGGCSGDVLAVRIAADFKRILSSDYLYYLLSSDEFFSYNMQHAKGAKMPRGNKAAILNYQIPIPCPNNREKSLAIQAEIVRILDAFTELTAKLTAELNMRKKQYNYYRDQLLSFEEDEVEWKTLEEVVHFANGKGHEKDISEDGKFIVVNSKFISRDGLVAKFSHNQICPLFKDDILLVMSDLPNGKALSKTFFVDEDERYTLNQRIGGITVKDKSEILPKFLHYYLDRTPQLLKHDNGVDQTNLRKGQILEVKVPIIPSEKQARIVNILDKFDKYTKSLSEGLPREIKLRQKQYEYYRDLLLSFPRSDSDEAA